MTRKYLYIEENGAEVGSTSRFYVVRCSQQGAQNLRDYLYLVAHSQDCGHYFELWSTEVGLFVQKLSQSLGFNVSERFQMVSSRDLVRSFRASISLPLNSSVLLQQDRKRKYLDINYRIISNLRARSSACGMTSKT